jgi:predicted regulator of Ras-like GTPase activity (Roadblock/LC7/MglB family)
MIVEWDLLKPNNFRELLKDYIAEGFCEILFWKNLKVMFVPDKRSYQGRFLFGVEELYASAQEKTKCAQMKLGEQHKQATSNKNVAESNTVTENQQEGLDFQTPEQKREVSMSEIKEAMEKMKAVDGFMGAAAFSAGGELIEEVIGSAGKMSELGALANDVLLKSQKTTDIMGVGRGNMIHITAPKANILVRCLNENTDFSANEPGRAHIHMMIIIEPEGNLALAKMRLEKAIQEAAPSVR